MRHPAGTRCPAAPPQPEGTLVAQVFGRALDRDGKLTAQTVRQERYAQDRFDVTANLQEALARVFAGAGTGRVRLPTELARLCVMHAYLGQIDVRPLSNPLGGTSDLKQCEFWAQRVGDRFATTRMAKHRGNRSTLMRVEGQSEVVSELNRRDGGPSYRHEIKLTWAGFIEINGTRMTRLLLSGRGREKLKWGSEGIRAAANSAHEMAYLPAGRPIDSAFEVRYGILGQPIQKE
jgi:hypothetical protein